MIKRLKSLPCHHRSICHLSDEAQVKDWVGVAIIVTLLTKPNLYIEKNIHVKNTFEIFYVQKFVLRFYFLQIKQLLV